MLAYFFSQTELEGDDSFRIPKSLAMIRHFMGLVLPIFSVQEKIHDPKCRNVVNAVFVS